MNVRNRFQHPLTPHTPPRTHFPPGLDRHHHAPQQNRLQGGHGRSPGPQVVRKTPGQHRYRNCVQL